MRLPVNPANDPPETNLPTPGDSSTPISQQQANSHPNSSTPLTSVDNPEFSNPDGPPSEVLPYHPTYLPKKVYFDSGQVPITRIPSSLMEQRNLLLRWIQFSLLETIASLSLGAVRRGIAKTSLGLNGLLIIIACYGLYASMSFRVLHIAIHAITLTSGEQGGRGRGHGACCGKATSFSIVVLHTTSHKTTQFVFSSWVTSSSSLSLVTSRGGSFLCFSASSPSTSLLGTWQSNLPRL